MTMHRLIQRETAGTFISRWLLRILLYFWALTILFPIIWMLYSSFKTPQEFMTNVWAWPKWIYIVNYIKAWIEADMSKYVLNTLVFSAGTVALFFIMCSSTSYILAKYNFEFKRFFRGFYFVAMMIPSILMLVPLYFQLEAIKEGITDNLFTLIIVYAVQAIPSAIFLLTGFIEGINNAFIEAAVIDGANEWQIFFKLVVPFNKPILFFLCLTNFMGTWNEYTTALTFLTSPSNYTISIGLQKMTSMFSYGNEHGAVFAGLVISMLPILILYSMFQKQIMHGTDSSEGLK